MGLAPEAMVEYDYPIIDSNKLLSRTFFAKIVLIIADDNILVRI
jgi:hypothetical protein